MLNAPASPPELYPGSFESQINTQPKSPGNRHRLPNLQARFVANGSALVEPEINVPKNSGGFFRMIIVTCIILGLLAGGVFVLVKFVGAEIARAGHTISTKSRHITINSDSITLPENTIRYASQRRKSDTKRLDLYFHWPSMQGYSQALKPEFNNIQDNSKIIFVSLSPRFSALDMSARIRPIYEKFYTGSTQNIGNGLSSHTLSSQAGFIDESLIVENKAPFPFAARCINENVRTATPYCIRDILVGNDLALTYRFHRDLIPQWRQIEQTIRNKFASMMN